MQQVQVGQQVFDFPALVEPDTAHQPVLGTTVETSLLQGPRLGVDPVHNGAIPGLHRLFPHQPVDLAEHEGGLFLLVVCLMDHQGRPLAVVGEQALLQPHAVDGNQVLGRLQDCAGGAVVLLQRDGLGLRVILLKA